MGKVLGIVNRKGGVGKTTTATTLSYLLSKEGCKVALIDFDGQRHTTKLCGVSAPEQLSVTIYDILKCQRQCDFVIFRRTGNVRKWRIKVCSL